MNKVSIKIGCVTVTVSKENEGDVLSLLGSLAFNSRIIKDGWITWDNPSHSSIGFAVFFDGLKIYADFHNLPYYYRDRNYNNRWVQYHEAIINHVRKHPSFSSWEGHASRFEPIHLPLLVNLLNELAEEQPELFLHQKKKVVVSGGDVLPAPPPPPKPRDNSITDDLCEYLAELESWAIANKSDALKDTAAFWILKVPAILVSATAGLWAHFELISISVFFGAIASFCIIIDGLHPRGML